MNPKRNSFSSLYQIEEEFSEESFIKTSSPRKKAKAFTQLNYDKSFLLEYDGFDENSFKKDLIKSTKRHYSYVDIFSNSFYSDESIDEEQKYSKISLEIKRKDIKKKNCIMTDLLIKPTSNPLLIQKIMSQSTKIMIKNVLKTHFLFGNLDLPQIERVISKMFPCEIIKEEFVFKEGEPATSFYLIEKGVFEVILKGEVKNYLKEGDCFGELALLYNSPRSASIRAIEKALIWGIDRMTFQKLVQETILKEYSINRRFIVGINVLKSLTEQQLDELAGHVITQKYKDNEAIVHEGDPANCFFIIKEGSVNAFKGDKFIREITEGCFGESVLLYESNRQLTIKSKGECTVLALSKSSIAQFLGNQINLIAFRNLQKWGLEKSKILKDLTSIQRERIIDRMKIKFEKAGTLLFIKDIPIRPKLVILHEGLIMEKNNNVLLLKGDLLGDDSGLMNEGFKVYDADYCYVVNSIISEIDSDVIEEVLGNKLSNVLKKNLNSYEKKINYNLIQRKEIDLELKNLIFIKRLSFIDGWGFSQLGFKNKGFGSYGSVYLVKDDREEGRFYALKAIGKSIILESGIGKYLKQEKVVLESISFPFIVNFIKTLKDSLNIYFLTEFIQGIDLFDAIRKIGVLNSSDAQYYIGSMILAIEYLHLNNIIHRDIKPENIMIDDKGFTKLVDMGSAKFLNRSNDKNILKTFTIIGTPHYMAPEIVKSKGYSFPVDYWSIGICLYELLCGMLPFGEETQDPYEIYEEILRKELKYPIYLTDRKARRLINQLLSHVPEVRVNGSFGSIKGDPWLEDFDWVSF